LTHIVDKSAEVEVLDGINSYDLDLAKCIMKAVFEEDTFKEKFLLYIDNPHTSPENYLTLGELMDILLEYVKRSELPDLPDLSEYVKWSELPDFPDLSEFITEAKVKSLLSVLEKKLDVEIIARENADAVLQQKIDAISPQVPANLISIDTGNAITTGADDKLFVATSQTGGGFDIDNITIKSAENNIYVHDYVSKNYVDYADANLQTNINNEATTRANADNTLQNQINDINNTIGDLETILSEV